MVDVEDRPASDQIVVRASGLPADGHYVVSVGLDAATSPTASVDVAAHAPSFEAVLPRPAESGVYRVSVFSADGASTRTLVGDRPIPIEASTSSTSAARGATAGQVSTDIADTRRLDDAAAGQEPRGTTFRFAIAAIVLAAGLLSVSRRRRNVL